jgi:hypothetical protein
MVNYALQAFQKALAEAATLKIWKDEQVLAPKTGNDEFILHLLIGQYSSANCLSYFCCLL